MLYPVEVSTYLHSESAMILHNVAMISLSEKLIEFQKANESPKYVQILKIC